MNEPGTAGLRVCEELTFPDEWAMYRYGSVELCIDGIEDRLTYFARVKQGRTLGKPLEWSPRAWGEQGSIVYVLAADDGHFDPVDHWHVACTNPVAVAERLDDLEDLPLIRMLNRAARLADHCRRPARAVARLSSRLPENREDELDDDEFNRLADEVAGCCPGVSPGMLYDRAMRLRESERRGSGTFSSLAWS